MTDYRALNRRKLVEFFENGAKAQQRLGVEIEHALARPGNATPVTYDEPAGVRELLEGLAPHFEHTIHEGDDIVGLSRPGADISLEPAAQTEISFGPFETVAQADAAYRQFRQQLDPVLERLGIETPLVGYNTVAAARDLQLIPKFRYQCMSEFLGEQSYFGWCMMRGSCSLQVSIDYADEADAVRKLRLGCALAPVLALMADNSPVFEGKPAREHLVRTTIWANMKQDRVGTVPHVLEPGYSFAQYADWIMTREAILAPTAEGAWEYVREATFDELYADAEMTDQQLNHALSMVWPDARLKNFVEVRPADALPLPYSMAYVALVKTLFYPAAALDALDALVDGVTYDDVWAAKRNLAEQGYDGTFAGRPAHAWADALVEIARANATEEDAAYLQPLAELVERRRTLADLALS